MKIEIFRMEDNILLKFNDMEVLGVTDYKIISSADGTTELTIKMNNPGAQIIIEGALSTKT